MAQLWVKILASRLSNHPLVRQVRLEKTYIDAAYRTGITERYIYSGPKRRRQHSYLMLRDQAWLQNPPRIQQQFEANPLQDHDPVANHIRMQASDLERATLAEKRVAAQEFLARFVALGAVGSKYPYEVLEQDFAAMQAANPERHIVDGAFELAPNIGRTPRPGFKILEHYFQDLSAVRPSRICAAINQCLAKSKHVDVTTATVCGLLRSWMHQKFYNPVGMLAVFKRLKFRGSIIDLSPDRGSKAMAAAALKLVYYTPRTPIFEAAVDSGFADILGLDYRWLDADTKADILLSDMDFVGSGMEAALPYLKQARRMVVYVSEADRAAIKEKFKPSALVPIRPHWRHAPGREHGYLAIW